MKVMAGAETLVIDGQPVWVVFNYHPEVAKRDLSKGRATQCLLLGQKSSPDAEPPVLAVGWAFQNERLDRYDKREGRKQSFVDALMKLHLGRPVREQVMGWFRTTMRQPEEDLILLCPHCGERVPANARRARLKPTPQEVAHAPTG